MRTQGCVCGGICVRRQRVVRFTRIDCGVSACRVTNERLTSTTYSNTRRMGQCRPWLGRGRHDLRAYTDH